jgi:hypothetical protein
MNHVNFSSMLQILRWLAVLNELSYSLGLLARRQGLVISVFILASFYLFSPVRTHFQETDAKTEHMVTRQLPFIQTIMHPRNPIYRAPALRPALPRYSSARLPSRQPNATALDHFANSLPGAGVL